jgi:hypothetical protein
MKTKIIYMLVFAILVYPAYGFDKLTVLTEDWPPFRMGKFPVLAPILLLQR